MRSKNRRVSAKAVLVLCLLLCILQYTPLSGWLFTSKENRIVIGEARAETGDYSSLFQSANYLRKGSKGANVCALQEVLKQLGFYNYPVDGVFGPNTEKALFGFQSSCGLSQDGILGPKTRQALEKSYLRKNPPEVHKVQKGETLSLVAEKYGVSIDSLTRINGLKDPDTIYEGQTLKIASPENVKGPEEPSSEEGKNPKEPPDQKEPKGEDTTPPPYPPPTKRICLSFDDGPDPSTTPVILSVLSRYGIKATFFLIGERVEKYPELTREIASRGHVIGVHGYEHKILAGLDRKEVRADLVKAQEAVKKLIGKAPRLYRPPGGYLDQIQVEEASRLGMTLVMWTNIGGADLGARDKDQVIERTIKASKDGGIILLHEGPSSTVEALPEIIENLARLGYGFQNPTLP